MKTARDVMDASPQTVPPDMPVQDLAALLYATRIDGVCVVEEGRLVGVVTTMDLIYKEKRLHLPTFFVFMDALLPLENPLRSAREIEKIAGAKVRDIMSTEPIAVGPEAGLDEIASLMVDKHLTLVPVVEHDKLLGIVGKPAILRHAFALR